MKAMILAAGRGERMRPLTDDCPKPLLEAGGKPLIVWQIERLRAAGFSELVINHAWRGERLVAALGDGRALGVSIAWSAEETALETAGGIQRALPLLGSEPFAVLNGDVFCDADLSALREHAARLDDERQRAHLLLVDNPAHHPQGDFHLSADGRLQREGSPRHTFAGIGVYHPQLFAGLAAGPAALAPLLRTAMDAGQVSASLHRGQWVDVGTPERLAALDAALRRPAPRSP